MWLITVTVCLYAPVRVCGTGFAIDGFWGSAEKSSLCCLGVRGERCLSVASPSSVSLFLALSISLCLSVCLFPEPARQMRETNEARLARCLEGFEKKRGIWP